MRKHALSPIWGGMLLCCLVLSSCSSGPEVVDASAKAEAKKAESGGFFSNLLSSSTPVVIPAGTGISITLDHAISSKENKPGDTFTGSLAAPIVIDGKSVVPRGSEVRGVLVDAQESGRLKGVARLQMALESLEVEGKEYDLQTTTVSRSAESHKKRNMIFIGGGTAAGAVLGGIAGGGKGAAIGAAAGAGAGTAAAAATGKKDILLPAETQLNFRLEEPLTIQVKKK
jgi:hypothetical protein